MTCEQERGRASQPSKHVRLSEAFKIPLVIGPRAYI
nr:MAG TPA: hypothetical protein [Caudoviricetes sp.]